MQRIARDLRQVRALQGSPVTMKATQSLADDPVGLWDRLAAKLLDATSHRSEIVGALFLLGVADGSLAEDGEDGGLGLIARVHDALDATDRAVSRLRNPWRQRDWNAYGMPTPRDEAVPRVGADGIRSQVRTLAEGLETLGLRSPTPETWLLTPAMRTFAQAALHAQTTATLSTSGRTRYGWSGAF